MIVVLGLGRETRELLLVLDREAAAASGGPRARGRSAVLVLDEGRPDPSSLPALHHLDVELVGGVDLDAADAVPATVTQAFRSPGISPYRAALAALRARGVPLTTPTGRWVAGRDGADVIAITGTKGKSTTAALTAHLLRAAGRRVSLRGNIGHPALLAEEPVSDDIVLELSSYQLADLDGRLGLGAVTTLLQDHVPWHGSVTRYHADKLRLLTLARFRLTTPQVAAHPAVPRGGVDAVTTPPGAAVRAALARAGLVGEHLATDAMVALALVDLRLGRPGGVADLVDALATFTPLPHRLTPVTTRAGVTWVDDSISTVPESAVAAVHAYRPRGPVTVLLGGDDRGQDLSPLVALLRDPEVRAVLVGPLAERLAAALAPVAADRVQRASDLPDAVGRAAALTPAGGAVLLSPAAPSFHAYRDFVARGEHFVALVTDGATD